MNVHKTKSKSNSKLVHTFEKELRNSDSEKESSSSEVKNGSNSFKNMPNNMINDKSEDNSSFISSSYFLDPTKERTPVGYKDAPTMERNKNKNQEKGDGRTEKLIQNTFTNDTEQLIQELAKESGIRPNFLQRLLHKSEQAKNRTGNEYTFGQTSEERASNSTNSIDRFVKNSLNSIKYTTEKEEGKLPNQTFLPKGLNNEEKNYSQSPNLNKSSFYEYINTYQYEPDKVPTYEKFITEKELRDPSEFENMVSDLRITFINWLKKTQAGFLREKDRLIKEKKELEMEKIKMQKELEEKRILDEEKIQEERKKLDIDIANNYKQLKKEKEENRKRFDEERLRFLQEIDKIKMILNLEKEKYNHEYKNFQVEKKKIVDANIATKTMIDINVGGVIFETSRHTLTQQKDSFLEKLFSGRHHIARDKNGRIFFDRDSEMFRMILNFLRNPLSIPVPKDLNESESLLKEAEFYGIKFLPFPLAFCIGGFDGVDYLNSVELLDVSQQCWRMCTPMQTKKAYFGSAVLNNFLYVFGGNNYDYKALFETEVYDRLRDVWYVGSNLNIPRRNNLGITMNGRIFSIGGYDGSSIIPNVEAYDNRMKAWVELAPLNTPRSSAMGVVHNNKIYVLGGTNGERLKTIEVYDEKMNQWEKFPHDLLEYRSAGTAFSYLNQIYVMGGVDNEHNVLNSVEQYQPFNKRWQFIPNIPEKRMNFGGTILSDSFILTGGECGDVLNSCYFFSPDNNEWQIGPPLLVPRFGHSMLVANL